MALDKEQQVQLLENRIAGLESDLFAKQADHQALEAEAALGTEAEGYENRLASSKADIDKTQARLKSYKDQLKSVS